MDISHKIDFRDDDLSGLDINFSDGEQLLLLDELRRITDQLTDVQEYISYLTRPVIEISRLRKETAGEYRTAKGHFYDCRSSIEALVTDEYHKVPYWTRTTVEHSGDTCENLRDVFSAYMEIAPLMASSGPPPRCCYHYSMDTESGPV